MLDAAQVLSESEDVGMIIIDSVKAFTSSIVEDKSAEQLTIGVEAKVLNARMPFVDGNCTHNNIALIVINQLRSDPGQMYGDPHSKKPGGRWQEFLPSLELHLSKDNQNIFKVGKETIGHTTKIKIKKSKYRGYEPKDVFTVNLYYKYGFNKYDEYAQLLVDKGTVEKTGGWYKFPNGEKVNGISAVSEFLESNDEYLKELIDGIK
jgi:RecA/RadA recombinase